MKRSWIIVLVVALIAFLITTPVSAENAPKPDPNFYIFLASAQSNMKASPRTTEAPDRTVDKRFQMLAAVDFNNRGRKTGQWYDATPPLCRSDTGLCPADY